MNFNESWIKPYENRSQELFFQIKYKIPLNSRFYIDILIRVRVGNRNGLLQSLGTWIDQGLVSAGGLFAHRGLQAGCSHTAG